MNAPTRIQPDPERIEADGWGPIEAAHRASISIHCPNETHIAMVARVALAMLRDQSSAGLRRCSDETAPILQTVTRLATMAVYSRMPDTKLHLVHGALASLMESARRLERAVNWADSPEVERLRADMERTDA